MLSWKQQEELRRQKEAEEGLYKYRVKVHGDDRDNEEIEEEEFRQNFPSFQQVRGQISPINKTHVIMQCFAEYSKRCLKNLYKFDITQIVQIS